MRRQQPLTNSASTGTLSNYLFKMSNNKENIPMARNTRDGVIHRHSQEQKDNSRRKPIFGSKDN